VAEVSGLVSMGVQGVMDTIGPGFERVSGHRLALTFNTSKMLLQTLRASAAPDVLVITREAIDGLMADGMVAAGSDVALAQSGVGIAVRWGAPKPDIATPDALKRAVLAARAIGYSDPAGGGASGVHFEKVLRELGIADAAKSKIKYPPVGTHTAQMLLTGEVDLAVQQIPELIFVQGIALVGPLPAALQLTTVFVGGVHAQAREPQAAQALLSFLRTPPAAEAFRTQGLEPASRD
jgi:molybdate transport system substrate-binding protein